MDNARLTLDNNARLTLDPQFIRPLVQLAADLDAGLADLPDLADLPGIVGIAGLADDLSARLAAKLAARLAADSTGTLTIGEREIELKVQDVSVSRGEVLLWTDKGTVTLVVDRYGDRLTWEVFDWDLEDEEEVDA